MKKTLVFALLVCISIMYSSCGNKNTQAQGKDSDEITEAVSTIQILYFHGDRRCPTCIKVGEISLNLFNTKYANNPKVKYVEVNTDKEENKTIAEKYQIMSSSLIIDVNGEVKNITVDAFKYAKSDPASLEKLMVEIIEAGLKK